VFRHFQNAFSAGSPFASPSDDQMQLVDRLAREIVRRHLTTPALAMLEMSRPLNFLGAQAMHFFAPVLTAIFEPKMYELFARFLERRDAISVIADRIEHFEQLATQAESKPDDPPSSSAE